MTTAFILILLTISFIGYWAQREALPPLTRAILNTVYVVLILVTVMTGWNGPSDGLLSPAKIARAA